MFREKSRQRDDTLICSASGEERSQQETGKWPWRSSKAVVSVPHDDCLLPVCEHREAPPGRARATAALHMWAMFCSQSASGKWPASWVWNPTETWVWLHSSIKLRREDTCLENWACFLLEKNFNPFKVLTQGIYHIFCGKINQINETSWAQAGGKS